MRVCLCTISYRDKLLEVALEAAAHVGFEAVELWGREPHVPEIYDESRVRGIRDMVAERGLTIAVFGSYFTFGKTVHREDSVALVDTLHTAHGLHAPIVRVWAADVPSAQASEEVWRKTVSEAQECCERAAKMSVVFAAEMHDGTLADTGPSARRLVEEVGRDNFRLNFQVGVNAAEDQVARLELVLPYVVHVHAQNFVFEGTGEGQRWVRKQLGEGTFDYGALTARLKEAGYQGHCAVEFAAVEGNGREASLKADLDYLASL